MRKLTVAVVVIGALLLLNLRTVHAFRCGTRLVDIGDTMRDVLDRCGTPNWVDSWQEERLFRGTGQATINKGQNFNTLVPLVTVIHVTVEEWTYNMGPTQFIRFLKFENGRLIDIQTGDYGF